MVAFGDIDFEFLIKFRTFGFDLLSGATVRMNKVSRVNDDVWGFTGQLEAKESFTVRSRVSVAVAVAGSCFIIEFTLCYAIFVVD